MSTEMGAQGVDIDEEEVANPLIKLNFKKNVGDHVCKVCKKAFTCGKALGGHMRIHNEEREGGKQHKVVVAGGIKEVEVDDLSSITCKLCYREFPSMKSLFGHMRCHPNRDWRGINPPPSYPRPPPPPPPPPPLKNSSSSTVSETALAQTDSGEDHGLRSGDGSSFKNWPVTARSARHSSRPMSLYDSAVEALCMLSRGVNLNKKKGEEEDSGYSIAAMYESGNESDGKSKIDNLEIGPCKIQSNQNQMSRKKVTKKRKLSALSGNGRYKCSTCNKSFHSHRALGGHRAGHKKNKNHRYPSNEEREFVTEQAAAEVTGAETAATTAAAAVHRCEVCEKTFPSGQALGGHKRRHWVNQAEAGSSSSSASPEEKKETGAGGCMFDIDLNKPPLTE